MATTWWCQTLLCVCGRCCYIAPYLLPSAALSVHECTVLQFDKATCHNTERWKPLSAIIKTGWLLFGGVITCRSHSSFKKQHFKTNLKGTFKQKWERESVWERERETKRVRERARGGGAHNRSWSSLISKLLILVFKEIQTLRGLKRGGGTKKMVDYLPVQFFGFSWPLKMGEVDKSSNNNNQKNNNNKKSAVVLVLFKTKNWMKHSPHSKVTARIGTATLSVAKKNILSSEHVFSFRLLFSFSYKQAPRPAQSAASGGHTVSQCPATSKNTLRHTQTHTHMPCLLVYHTHVRIVSQLA